MTPTRLTLERLDGRVAPAVLVTPAGGAGPDVHADRVPNDPSAPSQYALNAIQAPAAWDVAVGTGKTVVAVIDSGLDLTHPDLTANLWTNPGEVAGNGLDDDGNGYIDDAHGYDFSRNAPDPTDDFGHGTHVAGILGAAGDNKFGVTGVDWHVTVMPLRFLDARGDGYTGDAVRALNYAVANGAKVVNCSWGGAAPSPALAAAVAQARAAGVVVVAAAGNGSRDLATVSNYPASYAATFDNVVSVAATDYQDRLAGFSNFGATVTLAAPGDGILSTLPRGQYGTKSGTSMATAFVSGALALLWDTHPELTAAQVVAKLKASVDALPSLAGKTATGGRLNVARLLDGAATAPVPPPPGPPGDPVATPRGFVPTPVTPLPVARQDAVAVSVPGPGQAAVRLLNPDGTTRESLVLPGGEFAGGVRAAAADVTGDGFPDLVVASAPGVPGRVRVLDGRTHAVVWDLIPFGPDFTRGVFVACGDLTGDGVADLAVTPDDGGGPRVRVFEGRTFAQLADFFGIADPAFRGGARAAIGDLTGDGVGDLVVAAGTGGGPRVAAYDGTSLAAPRHLFGDFFAFEPGLRNGAYVAVGDVNGDGVGDLVAGGGPGGGPRVLALDGAGLLRGESKPLANFFAGDPTQRDGVRVAVKDLDADGKADVVVGGTGRVAGYTAKTLLAAATPTAGFAFDLALDTPLAAYVG